MTRVDSHDHGAHAEDPLASSGLAEELRGALHAVADRAEPLLRTVSEGTGDTAEPGRLPATCHWCPVCATVAVLRGQRPELAVRAAEHGVALVELLREVAAEPRTADGWTTSGELSDEELGDRPTAPRAGTAGDRVQRIAVRRPGGRPVPGAAEHDVTADVGAPAEDGDGSRVQRIDVRRRGSAGAGEAGDTR